MRAIQFDTVYCKGEFAPLVDDSLHDFVVVGTVKEQVTDDVIHYIAACPPDYRATYTGSGLPFANQPQAFQGSPNQGSVKLIDGTFEIRLMFPNSYYIGLGTVLVPPTLFIRYVSNEGKDRSVSVNLSEGIPYRTLTYPSGRKDATFYKGGWEMPVRTQEKVLRDSGYPSKNVVPPNHWGLKPPL